MAFLLDYKYAYLVGNMILFLVWLTIFILRKDLRREQLVVGVIVGFFAPITDYLIFYKDYWRPEYLISFTFNNATVGIESPLFGFLIGGISAVIYESFAKRKSLHSKPRNIIALLVVLGNIFGTLVLVVVGVNSIWSSVTMLVIGSIFMIFFDKDLIDDMFWSSVILTFTILILYSIWFWIYPDAYQKFWVTERMTGIMVGKIPIEELAWFSSAGLFIGILYEFWKNVRKYKKI